MACSGADLTEGMQFRGPRLAKEAIPGFGSKSQNTGKASFEIAKFYGADQGREISAERAQEYAILGARLERYDQKDRGASERRGDCLRESRRFRRRFGRGHWIKVRFGIGFHLSSAVAWADSDLQNLRTPLI